MDLLTKELKDEIVKCAQANKLGFYSWGFHLQKGSIAHKQLDGSTVVIQIYIPERRGYSDFEKVMSELDIAFGNANMQYSGMKDLGEKNGWFKELEYVADFDGRNTIHSNNSSTSMLTIPPTTMNYKALLIGVNEYVNKRCYSDLSAVSNDITVMGQILNNSPCQYQVAFLSGRNATHTKINKELNHFFESEKDDVLFLYWAGHGTVNHFIAHDTDPANECGTAIDLRSLADMIEQTRSSAVVVVLDCCHSGAIARGAFDLRLSIKGDGKVIMASSDYYQPSYESSTLGHGCFTHCFIEGLEGKAASDKGLITVTSLHDYICEQIDTISGNKQTPVLKLTMAGQFVLNVVTPGQTNQSGGVLTTQGIAGANRTTEALLSHEEQIVIKTLSLDDSAAVQVNTSRTLSDNGLSIYIRGDVEKSQIDLNSSCTKREFTKWTEIVDGLVYKGLLSSKHFGSGVCYSLSHNGYIAADAIDKAILDNIPSMLSKEVDALSDNEKVMLKATSLSEDGKILCSTNIISDSEKIETLDGSVEFANGMDAKQTALWNDAINCLVQAEMLISLMGGKGQRYFKLTQKGYTIASRVDHDVLKGFEKKR